MKKSKRYDTSHLIEDQPEPGSRGRVLRNKIGARKRIVYVHYCRGTAQ